MRCVLYNLPCDVRGFVMEDNETLEPVCVLNARLTHEANQKTFLHEAEHINQNDLDREDSADVIEEKRHKKRPCIVDTRQGE